MTSSKFYEKKWHSYGKKAARATSELDKCYYRSQQKEVHHLMMTARVQEENKSLNKRKYIMDQLLRLKATENKTWDIYRNYPDVAEELNSGITYRIHYLEKLLQNMKVTYQEAIPLSSLANKNDDDDDNSDDEEEEKEIKWEKEEGNIDWADSD